MSRAMRTAAESNGPLSDEAARYFRDALKDARAAALRDAEGFTSILYAVERLGRYLEPGAAGLHDMKGAIQIVVERSPLTSALRDDPRCLQTPFESLFELVREGRNGAMHEGAFARHLTDRSIDLALMIEDALVVDMNTVRDYMVRNPVTASPWQPLSFVRHAMLASSFSFLPVLLDPDEGWRLLSDLAPATFLRGAHTKAERGRRLGQAVRDAVASGGLDLVEPFVCAPGLPADEALAKCRGLPVLIHGERTADLIGIACPYDLL